MENGDKLMENFFKSNYVDIISPQLYSLDIGTANEYTPTNSCSWAKFKGFYDNRANKDLKIYPSLWSIQDKNGTYDLWNKGGTTNGKKPIISIDPKEDGDLLIKFTVDNGAKDFFDNILGIPASGCIQFINGTISKVV
jgi:hypothetical protein